MKSITGTWGTEFLSEKLGNPNSSKIAEAEITSNRLGFVKIDYSEPGNLKPASTYKEQFSTTQIDKIKEDENKNIYSKYVIFI